MSKIRSRFLAWAYATLVFVYLVILAGSVVRATGSGMGCPDWPKCFGHYIPPTQVEQLLYEDGRQFRKGHFIIHDEALWKARLDLTATDEINPDHWEKYTKHDYARFNVMHTWTEYVNRLMGATLGVVSFVMLLVSFPLRREDAMLPVLSGVVVFLIGFEGWLGATVVESNLQPAKITTHMLVALVIVALVVATINRTRRAHTVGKSLRNMVPRLKLVLGTGIFLTLAQVVIGTQVREHVDTLDALYEGAGREGWIEQIGALFRVHAIMAYIVIFINGYAGYLLWRSPYWAQARMAVCWLMGLLMLEWLSGVILGLYALPPVLQPAHLVIATLVFGAQAWVWSLRDAGSTVPAAEPAPQV